jgi:sugar lactone lactonase YvrE
LRVVLQPTKRLLEVLFKCVLTLFALLMCATGLNAQTAPPLLPNGVAYDSAGDLYFVDSHRHQVYESSLGGVLTVVAGSGTQGFAGDNGPATSAQLSAPQGVAIGPDGTLYIADTGNQRIRAVSSGQISTFAGTGIAGFTGDGSSAVSATLHSPTALAIDASGALLVCDTANYRIRRISGGTISTIAGSGVQGFAGDAASALAAQLDTPSGLAVGPDGRIYIADSHNNRIRVITTDGLIRTLAGTGARGYSGDGGAATAAQLALPRGLVVTAGGALVFADSNNQRVRSIDAQGIISTIAGNGVQGSSNDANSAVTSALDTPRGVALSSFGSPVIADASNHEVRESVSNGNLYLPAGLASSRSSTVSLAASATSGQSVASVSVTGSAGTPQGSVTLYDGASLVAQSSLTGGTASFSLSSLASGPHTLRAAYLGDGVNPAATSSVVTVNPGATVVTAVANAETIDYGQPIPELTGTLSGVIPQDVGNVSAVFSTTATPLSSPGSYAITATLTGSASANYTVVLSPSSGSLSIDQANSVTTEQALAQNSYGGLPLVLSAKVVSTTQGTPTGTVQFMDSGTLVATATLIGGTASATYLSPTAGDHTVIASYMGDKDFAASSSQAMSATVGAMPDFALSASSGTQTISSGGVAAYDLTVGAQPAPFTGVVYLSASGLPAGATATFSPPQTVPGTTSAVVTMSIQTVASTQARRHQQVASLLAFCLMLPLALVARRRRCGRQLVTVGAVVLVLSSMVGCGARSISTAALSQQVYTLQVKGTATNLAGNVVTHATSVTLIVQ